MSKWSKPKWKQVTKQCKEQGCRSVLPLRMLLNGRCHTCQNIERSSWAEDYRFED